MSNGVHIRREEPQKLGSATRHPKRPLGIGRGRLTRNTPPRICYHAEFVRSKSKGQSVQWNYRHIYNPTFG